MSEFLRTGGEREDPSPWGDGYFDEERCADCGGECCRHGGFFFSAEDKIFAGDLSYEHLRQLLADGQVVIEQVGYLSSQFPEGQFIYIVAPPWRYDQEGQEVCMHYSDDEPCELAGDERPKACRHFEPRAGGYGAEVEWCRSDARVTEEIVLSWARHQDVLYRLWSGE